MSAYASSSRFRLPAALAAAAIQLAVGLALIWGLTARLSAPSSSPPLAVTVPSRSEPSPPPQPEEDPGGRPDAPAPKAEPQPREAPRPDIPIPVPSSAAPKAGEGAANAAGAATAGSGTGGGGNGTGSGSGTGAGAGTGTKARWVSGAFSDRDYARTAELGPPSGAVTIAFRVRSDGRVDRCRAVASSGGAELNAHVCGLYERRYRFAPARNAAGEAIDSELRTTVEWGPRRRG